MFLRGSVRRNKNLWLSIHNETLDYFTIRLKTTYHKNFPRDYYATKQIFYASNICFVALWVISCARLKENFRHAKKFFLVKLLNKIFQHV